MQRPRLNDIPEDSESVNSILSGEEEENEPVIVEMGGEELPIKDFEPIEKQRHFGLLHLTVTSEFRRMMVIGMVNVILVIVFFLFILFFLELHKDNTIVITPSTLKPKTTESPGWCTGLYHFYHGKCLRQASPTDHIKAEADAINYGTYLATMHNEKEIKIVKGFLNAISSYEVYWIGMYCTGNNITDFVWDDTTAVENDNFEEGHPDISKGLCVSYNITNSKWRSTHCSETLPQVNEMPVMHQPSGGCSDTLGDFCYSPVYTPTSFSAAKHDCEIKCGHLSSVNSAVENEYLHFIFKASSNKLIALGGYATSKDNILWHDGSPMTFNNIQQFNGPGCLYFTNDDNSGVHGNWFTADCSTKSIYVCKKPVGATCTNKVTVKPTPRVLESCNSAPLQESGSFASPNYPNYYPPYTNCTWILVTYGPEKLYIAFENVRIGKDVIRVFDGDSDANHYLGSLTDSHAKVFYTSGNVAFVTFRTGDNQYQFTGFNASFITVY